MPFIHDRLVIILVLAVDNFVAPLTPFFLVFIVEVKSPGIERYRIP